MNLYDILTWAVADHPEGMAVIDGETSMTYHDLYHMVDHMAAAMQKMGIRAGHRVVILLENSLPTVVLFWALMKSQTIVVPLNVSQAFDVTHHCVRDVNPHVVIYGCASAGTVKGMAGDLSAILIGVGAPNAPMNYEELLAMPTAAFAPPGATALDVAVILYTSGTSGMPKGVPRTHTNGIAAASAHIAQNGYHRYERVLATMSLSHTMGLHLLLATAMQAGTLVLYGDSANEGLRDVIVREHVSALYMIPTLYHTLVSEVSRSFADIPTINNLGYAGAPMSDRIVQACYAMFHPQIFLNHYGSTEIYTHTVSRVRAMKPGCVGNIAATDKIRLVHPQDSQTLVTTPGDVGEILVPSHSAEAFAGYWNRPDMTYHMLCDGWYHTGDLGHFDSQGDLFVVGRTDDIIISGGQHIHPAVIESLLQGHPKVQDVAVAGEPDDRWGQIVVAYVVAATLGLTPFELDGYCKREGSLPVSIRPRKYVFARNIPRSATGKVLRRTLANLDGVCL